MSTPKWLWSSMFQSYNGKYVVWPRAVICSSNTCINHSLVLYRSHLPVPSRTCNTFSLCVQGLHHQTQEWHFSINQWCDSVYKKILYFHMRMRAFYFSFAACLCVHVLESRPSLVALCLRGGSVYMRGSQAYGRVWVGACAHRTSSSSLCVWAKEKEHILYEVPGLSRVFPLYKHTTA